LMITNDNEALPWLKTREWFIIKYILAWVEPIWV